MDTLYEFEFNVIYILESLRENEDKTGQDLYHFIENELGYKNTKFFNVSTRKDFFNSFMDILKTTSENSSPIIHLEIHGSKKGLQLNNGEFVLWLEIKSQLQKINIKCKNNLFLTLAVCEGAFLISIIENAIGEPAPFWALLGSSGELLSTNISVGFKEYYRYLLNKDHNPNRTLNDAQNIINAYNRTVPYKTIISEIMLRNGLVNYLFKHETKEKLNIRIKEMLNISAQEFSMSTKQLRKLLCKNKKIYIKNNSKFKRYLRKMLIKIGRTKFREYRRKFLMLDIYPELQKRVNINFQKILEFTNQLKNNPTRI